RSSAGPASRAPGPAPRPRRPRSTRPGRDRARDRRPDRRHRARARRAGGSGGPRRHARRGRELHRRPAGPGGAHPPAVLPGGTDRGPSGRAAGPDRGGERGPHPAPPRRHHRRAPDRHHLDDEAGRGSARRRVDPRRRAATTAALRIGTTLRTMMAVGARTAESTLTSELDSRRPIDMVISAEAMPEDAAAQIAAIDGMDTAHSSARGDIEVGSSEPMTLYSATPEALRETSHRPGMAEELADGVVLLGQERAEQFGLEDGQVLHIDGPDGTHELHVQVDANLQMSLVTPATLAQLVGDGTRPV